MRPLPHLLPAAILTSTLACALTCLLAAPAGALESAPVNPAYLAHLLDQPTATTLSSGPGTGLVPSPLAFSPEPAASFGTLAALPASFDLRGSGRVSAVRNQGGCGSCWSFATLATLESEHLPAQMFDFSENNMIREHGFELGPCSGGNGSMAMAYLVRGDGPLLETDDPYSTSATAPSLATAYRSRTVNNVIFLPRRGGPLDNEGLKRAIMERGAVYSTVYMTTSSTYFNASRSALHYNGTRAGNHAITLVGWDDDYPAANFPTRPAGDGAYIVKNSWGSWWGDDGYFMVSYHDHVLGYEENLLTHDTSSVEDSLRIYQHDTLGAVFSYGVGASTTNPGRVAMIANVFQVQSVGTEYLSRVGFFAPEPDASYVLSVHLNPDQAPVSSDGAVLTEEVSVDPGVSGYFTHRLSTPVVLQPGDTFSVVLRVTPSAAVDSYVIPVESTWPGYATASGAAGQSYFSEDQGGTWKDMWTDYSGNICVKAYVQSDYPALEEGVESDGDTASTSDLERTPSTTRSSGGGGGCVLTPNARPGLEWLLIAGVLPALLRRLNH